MTIGVAAISWADNAIVLVADRAVTYGEVQGTAGRPKRLKLTEDEQWQTLFAGSPGIAERVVWAARNKLPNGPTADQVRDEVHRAYMEVRREIRHDLIVDPHKEEPRNDRVIEDVHDRLDRFRLNCELIVAGFQGDDPILMTVSDFHSGGDEEQSLVVDSSRIDGFAVIGSGSSSALNRLTWTEPDPRDLDDPLDVVLYRAFEAKAYAEQNLYVGYQFDAWILVHDARKPLRKVRDATIERLLDPAFDAATDLPFGWLPRHGRKEEGRTGHGIPPRFSQDLRAAVENLIGRRLTSYRTWGPHRGSTAQTPGSRRRRIRKFRKSAKKE